MMDCQSFERQIHAYIDGMLSGSEQEALLRHAASCPNCAALLQEMQALEALLCVQLTQVDAPTGFAEQVMAALPPAYEKKPVQLKPRKRALWVRFGSIAAAAALLLAIGLTGLLPDLSPGDNPPENPPLQIAAGDRTPPAVLLDPPGAAIERLDPAETPDTNPVPHGRGQLPQLPAMPNPVDDTPAANNPAEAQPEQQPGDTPGDQPGDTSDGQLQPPVNNGTDTPVTAENDPPTEEGDPSPLVSISLPLPAAISDDKVTYDSDPKGQFDLLLLAAHDTMDAVLPRLVVDEKSGAECIEYLTVTSRGEYFKHRQYSLSAKESPAYVDKAISVPSVTGITKSEEVNGFAALWALSPNGRKEAYNLASGSNPGIYIRDVEVLAEGQVAAALEQPEEVEAACVRVGAGGGKVLSWSSDSNKLLYTDAAGLLFIYYPDNSKALPVFEGKVSCASWLPNSKKIVFAGTPTEPAGAYSNIYMVSVP